MDRKILAEIAVADMPGFGQLAANRKVSPERLSAESFSQDERFSGNSPAERFWSESSKRNSEQGARTDARRTSWAGAADYAAAARSEGPAGGGAAAAPASSSINCGELSRHRLDERLETVKEQAKAKALAEERIDITLPGHASGSAAASHPLTLVIDEIIDIFWGMGFEIARGPDIEDDYHNFEALNIPKDHPARDMQDTFFVSNGELLRTHTSPVQIRTMESRKPPLQIIVPGAVYRHDDDATHSPMFHQVEGFMVDERIAFSDLKGVLTHVLRQIFSGMPASDFGRVFFRSPSRAPRSTFNA